MRSTPKRRLSFFVFCTLSTVLAYLHKCAMGSNRPHETHQLEILNEHVGLQNIHQSCSLFEPISDDETLPVTSTITLHSPYGRLGNRLRAIGTLFAIAEEGCCHIQINMTILDDWNPGGKRFKYVGLNCVRTESRSLCTSVTGYELFSIRDDYKLNTCAVFGIKSYFKSNETHSMNKECAKESYATLHVRSGDVVAGQYNRTSGTYMPNKVHPNYWLYPTSYYIQAIYNIKKRQKRARIIVFCETMENPTCDTLASIQTLLPGLEMKVANLLREDLHLMFCASDMVTSFGTFQIVSSFSSKAQIKHQFVKHLPTDCSHVHQRNNVYYSIKDPNERMRFHEDISPWYNNEYQRHLISKHTRIQTLHCDN